MNNTCVYHHEPESKQEAEECYEPGPLAPKQYRVHKSTKEEAGFWDPKWIFWYIILKLPK